MEAARVGLSSIWSASMACGDEIPFLGEAAVLQCATAQDHGVLLCVLAALARLSPVPRDARPWGSMMRRVKLFHKARILLEGIAFIVSIGFYFGGAFVMICAWIESCLIGPRFLVLFSWGWFLSRHEAYNLPDHETLPVPDLGHTMEGLFFDVLYNIMALYS